MLLIRCPYCDADRPELDFVYAGQAHVDRPRDPSTLSDVEWRDFLYTRSNTRGAYAERWRHANGCGRFFNAIRDTVSDKFAVSYKSGEQPPSSAGLAHEKAPT